MQERLELGHIGNVEEDEMFVIFQQTDKNVALDIDCGKQRFQIQIARHGITPSGMIASQVRKSCPFLKFQREKIRRR
jgi:hypothetical protein